MTFAKCLRGMCTPAYPLKKALIIIGAKCDWDFPDIRSGQNPDGTDRPI